MKDFHELKVWQKAHQLTLAVYKITSTFPREELYGLTTQLRRARSSIRRIWRRDADAMGMPSSPASVPSPWDRASELEYHLLLARDLKLVKPKHHEDLAQRAIELKRMLTRSSKS